MSPIRSPTLVSGVASFSPYLSLACRQLTGRSSPSSAASRRHRAQAGWYGWSLIEQAGQGADQPGLTLAAFAEQDDVVLGDQGALEVRQDGLPEPYDAGKGILPGSHPGEQVLPDLVLDTAVLMAAGSQLGQGGQARRLAASRSGRGRRVGWRTRVMMLAVLLHHSTVCRDRTSSHPSRPGRRPPGPRRGRRDGTLASRGNNTWCGQRR